jgi:hypothetical protein
LNKVGFTSDKEIRRVVLEKIGTKPIDLRHLATSKMKPLEFIEKQIKENKKKLEGCFQDDPKCLNLFKEMIKDEYKDGMEGDITMRIMSLSTEKIAEGSIVKGNHILSYDIERGIFKFHSNSMREATRRFIETNNK